jgi:hypothetical protein
VREARIRALPSASISEPLWPVGADRWRGAGRGGRGGGVSVTKARTCGRSEKSRGLPWGEERSYRGEPGSNELYYITEDGPSGNEN